jgi:large subunit ribosomal protein L15
MNEDGKTRKAMKLNELKDNPGARKVGKRVGRGIGSGKGKTAGRGVKGQWARSGVAVKGFEGGQMPLHRRLPKRGFNNVFAKDLNEVNLGRVQEAIDAGKLDAGSTVDVDALVKAGVLRRAKHGVRLLGSGELKAKVAFSVYGASKSARAAVEKAGGSVEILAPQPEAGERAA